MSDDWMTPQLREATARFNAAVAEATEASREASATARELVSRDVAGTPEYQRMERKVADYFRSGRGGSAARELQEKVDGGKLTWPQIANGEVDEEATTLYRENLSAILAGIATAQREDSDEGDDEPPDDDPDDDGPVFRGIY